MAKEEGDEDSKEPVESKLDSRLQVGGWVGTLFQPHFCTGADEKFILSLSTFPVPTNTAPDLSVITTNYLIIRSVSHNSPTTADLARNHPATNPQAFIID